MRKVYLIALGMLVPVAASAALLASVEDRSAASGSYYVNTGLATQFGRMAGDGDYLPGGLDSDGDSGFGNPTASGSMILTRRRLLK